MNDATAEWELLMGNDIQLRRRVRGYGQSAEMGTSVRCNLRGYLSAIKGNKNSDWEISEFPFEELSDEWFTIGEGDAIPGLELALRNSRTGDSMEVRITSRFAYGPRGRPKVRINHGHRVTDTSGSVLFIEPIPPNTDLVYHVEIIEHVAEGTVSGEHTDEVFKRNMLLSAELKRRKESGNRWFNYGDYQRAARAYSKGTKIAQSYHDQRQESIDQKGDSLYLVNGSTSPNLSRLDEEISTNYISCLNNLAACHLKMGENLLAKELCVRVLEIDQTNVKALLRASKACLALDLYEEAELCLKRLNEISPTGSPAALAGMAELQLLRQAKQKYRKNAHAMAANIARKLFGGTDAKGMVLENPSTSDQPFEIEVATAAASHANTEAEQMKEASAKRRNTDISSKKHEDRLSNSSSWGYLLILLCTSVIVMLVSIVTLALIN